MTQPANSVDNEDVTENIIIARYDSFGGGGCVFLVGSPEFLGSF